jgi:manganese transport protein
MPVSAVLSFVTVMALLGLEKRGFRPMEIVVGVLVAMIALSYGAQLVISDPQWSGIAHGLLVPTFGGDDGAYLAAGILGATVMPHVIYLHSGLMQRRVQVAGALKPRLMRFHTGEIVVAMGIAGFVNAAMLAAAAAAFQGRGATGDLTQAWQMLVPLFGPGAAVLFAVALLASGISSSVVGTMSGQVVMQGFVNFSVPLWLRRSLTSLPALALILSGADPSEVLVFSQVVLSFGIPFALVPLVQFTSRRDLMGELVNRRVTSMAGWAIAAVVIALNGYLLLAGA